ncbi:MAG: hypothetical protein E7130_04610 [Rikenellaceae bacterium]|nr:hypothetical protein [Rikenellaceae bacterium]
MEDVLYYIGLGLLITFSLALKVGKTVARKGAKRSHTPKSVPPPGFPTFEALFEEIEKKNSNPAPQTEPVEWSSEAQSLETIFDEEEMYAQNRSNTTTKPHYNVAGTPPQKKGNNNKKDNRADIPVQKENKPQNKAQNSGNEAISEDFNLREAVIYSEILKPKFEE